MSEKEYKEYLEEGKKLFEIIGDDLNNCEFIRKETFRREDDFNEICVALALLANTFGMIIE